MPVQKPSDQELPLCSLPLSAMDQPKPLLGVLVSLAEDVVSQVKSLPNEVEALPFSTRK